MKLKFLKKSVYLEYIILNEVTQSQKENTTCCLSYEQSIQNIYVYIKKYTCWYITFRKENKKS